MWENGAPGALGDADTDRPTLTIFRASGRGLSGTSVIIAPGGGYVNLSMNNEGRNVAAWFNSMGVSAFVLKYRLGPRYRHPIELGDAQRAIRLVRSRSAQYGVAPDRIGMMGFSAGRTPRLRQPERNSTSATPTATDPDREGSLEQPSGLS